MSQESSKLFIGVGIAAILSILLLSQGSAMITLKSIYADGKPTAVIAPFFQLPGGSVMVTAQGLAPNANATIIVKNVVARVQTETLNGLKTTTFPDSIVVGNTETKSDGTLEWALGVPRDDVRVIERWINNSTGQVTKTVTTDYRFQGTVEVQITDEIGNTATSELTVLRWITEAPFK